MIIVLLVTRLVNLVLDQQNLTVLLVKKIRTEKKKVIKLLMNVNVRPDLKK